MLFSILVSIIVLLIRRATLIHSTIVEFVNVRTVGDPSTACLATCGSTLEIITGSFEGGCAIEFHQLKLPNIKSLSNQVLEFDMKFLKKPSNSVGRCGGIYYGNHELERFVGGNIVLDWIDRTDDRGYRFYDSGLESSHSLNVLLPRTNEPASHLKIIIKSTGEHIVAAGNDIWKRLNGSAVQLLDTPYLGFWAFYNNHIVISNFSIHPYTGEKNRTMLSK
ncbi:unnamed protein product [Rotaria sp. Silwood2]|nr:unnamed protein product [Rotaria sp. Silwood2]CAF4197669.1 unnamed protein product [Rotaria sp. Silwood2]